MNELVCLQCGKEIEYDWAACPNCGWKAPETWEESAEEPESTTGPKNAFLASQNKWIRWTTWILLAAVIAGLFFFFD